MAAKFRKKPVEIEAVQWFGDNKEAMESFVGNSIKVNAVTGSFGIETLEGTMTASPGDWVIKGIQGEFYPCKNEIFFNSYELVD